MNAPVIQQTGTIIDPIEIFKLRAWARAFLFAEGVIDLHGAVDALQEAADHDGIDRDVVQSIIAAAFEAVR